jgi:hypothetical protein
LASPYCDTTRVEVFIDGTRPTVECQLHDGVPAQVVVSGPQGQVNQGSADRMLVPMPDRQPPN